MKIESTLSKLYGSSRTLKAFKFQSTMPNTTKSSGKLVKPGLLTNGSASSLLHEHGKSFEGHKKRKSPIPRVPSSNGSESYFKILKKFQAEKEIAKRKKAPSAAGARKHTSAQAQVLHRRAMTSMKIHSQEERPSEPKLDH